MTTIDRTQFWEDRNGKFVPVNNIKEVDKLRDEVVNDVFKKAQSLHNHMREVKNEVFDAIGAFIALSAEEYNVKLGGNKGNTTLFAFNGKYKIQYAISEYMQFDERIHAARKLIDECLKDWTKDSNDELKTLINQAFSVDKQGNLSTGKILALRRYEITDDRWQEAMKAISDSLQVIDSKSYIRVYERDANGKYIQLPLDFAAI